MNDNCCDSTVQKLKRILCEKKADLSAIEEAIKNLTHKKSNLRNEVCSIETTIGVIQECDCS